MNKEGKRERGENPLLVIHVRESREEEVGPNFKWGFVKLLQYEKMGQTNGAPKPQNA